MCYLAWNEVELLTLKGSVMVLKNYMSRNAL